MPADPNAWTRPTGRTEHEIAETPPDHCPDGHPLTPGRVIVGGGNQERTYLCRRCGLMIVRTYATGLETVTQREPA